jgi:hypothetical protein
MYCICPSLSGVPGGGGGGERERYTAEKMTVRELNHKINTVYEERYNTINRSLWHGRRGKAVGKRREQGIIVIEGNIDIVT